MKKFLLFLVVLITFLPALVKAQEPYWEYSGLKNLRLASLITHQDGTVFAGTQYGIYSSSDYGKTWELRGAPNSAIISLAINNQGYIFGGAVNSLIQKGGLWRSLDTGKTWTQHLEGLVDDGGNPFAINGIACKEQGLVFIANDIPAGFLRSYNNGDTWEAKLPENVPNPDWNIIIGLQKELIGVGFHSVIRSYDNGDTWEDLKPTKADTSNPLARFLSIAQSPKGYLYTGSAYAGLLRSKDNGKSWKQLKDKFLPFSGMDSLDFVNKIVFAKDGAMYAVADGRGIFRSFNDGDTWQNFWSGVVPQDSLQAMEFLAMCQDSAGYLYVTTSKGIYRTRAMYVSVDENNNEFLKENIRVYPNPTSENITISFPQNFSFKTTKLTLRDITGREIFLKEFSNEKTNYTFSLKEIPVGVYMLEVRSGNEFFTKQISVIR